MPLSAATLKTEISSAIVSALGVTDPTKTDDFADALATAIVDHITANSTVTGTATVATGSSAGTHPVTGTVS